MTRRDDGAVAVVVALLATVLFGVGALCVDLGHAWAVERAVQRQADLAALSAGHVLPSSSVDLLDVAEEVAEQLNANRVSGQAAVTAADLVDQDLADGEVLLHDGTGSSCAEACVQLSVHAPAAHVDFGLAAVLGRDGVDVQKAATVRLESPLPRADDILPFWLPSGCALGPAMADTGPGSAQATSEPAVTVGEHTVSGAQRTTAAGTVVTVDDLLVHQLPPRVDRASIRFRSPDGTFYVDYASQPAGRTDPMAVSALEVGPEVTGTVGTWSIEALVQQRGTDAVTTSATSVPFTVVAGTTTTATTTATATATTTATSTPSPSPTSAPVGCVGQARGNFGQLVSPRRGVTGRSTTLALNIASGLDHQLVPYPGASTTTSKECVSPGGALLPGAVLDDTSRDGANCILADPGNDGPALLDGLVTGVDGVPGRLSEARGPTTCPDRPDLVVEGVSVNNDTLFCFLRPGATLDSITRPSPDGVPSLDAAVLDSPRLVWLPVVHAADRAQKRFQPIRTFTPAFITSETQASGPTSTNGFTVGGGTLTSVQVFVFDATALPVDPRTPSTRYESGLPEVLRLVQ